MLWKGVAVTLNISKAFDKVRHAGLPHRLRSYGILGQIFDLILSFVSIRWLQVVLVGKSSQEYPVNAGVPQMPFLVLLFSYYTLLTFLIILSPMLLSMLMVLRSTLSGIRHLIAAKTRDGCWTWILFARHFGLGQEVACKFQCLKNSTCFVWVV